jgi:hypothetical protein
VTDYGLIERSCKGGCERKFKVMAKSDQWYARKDCQHVCFGVPRTVKQTRKMILAPIYHDRKERSKHIVNDELAAFCDRLVGHAEKLKIKDNGARLDVAFFAIEAKRVCGTAYHDFASRAKLKKDELCDWVSVYEKIASVIPSETLLTYEFDFLVEAAKDMRQGMTKNEVLVLLKTKMNENEIVNLVEYKGHLEDMRTYFMGKDLDHLNKKELGSIHELIKDLSKKFRFWANGRP